MGIRKRKVSGLIVYLFAMDPPSIAATSSASIDNAIPGLTTQHKVLVTCNDNLENGLVFQGAYVPSNGILRITLYNSTAAAIDGVSRNWLVVAWLP